MVWYFCGKSDHWKFERLQENALRSVYYDKSSAYDELLVRAKLHSLLNRRLRGIAIVMCKVSYNLCPSYISDIFNLSNRSYNLRNSDNFMIPRINKLPPMGNTSIRYIGPVIWSKLSVHINSSVTLAFFKNQVRKVDIENLLRTDT